MQPLLLVQRRLLSRCDVRGCLRQCNVLDEAFPMLVLVEMTHSMHPQIMVLQGALTANGGDGEPAAIQPASSGEAEDAGSEGAVDATEGDGAAEGEDDDDADAAAEAAGEEAAPGEGRTTLEAFRLALMWSQPGREGACATVCFHCLGMTPCLIPSTCLALP